MRLNVIGVKRISGLTKANNSPFDMCSVMALSAVETIQTERLQVAGFGFEVMEVALDPAALAAFAHCKFPCVLDLVTDVRPFRGKLETVVVGVKDQPKAVAA